MSTGRRTDASHVVGFTWTVTDEWVFWEPGQGLASADQLAAARCDDQSLAEALAAAIRTYEQDVARGRVVPVFLALWVPDPAGPPAATAMAYVVAPPAGTGRRLTLDERLELARSRHAAKGYRLVEAAAFPSRVAAGEAVLHVADVSPRFRRAVERSITWYVLPAGTQDTVIFQCQSESVAHFDLLADYAAEIANTITVRLGDA